MTCRKCGLPSRTGFCRECRLEEEGEYYQQRSDEMLAQEGDRDEEVSPDA